MRPMAKTGPGPEYAVPLKNTWSRPECTGSGTTVDFQTPIWCHGVPSVLLRSWISAVRKHRTDRNRLALYVAPGLQRR